LAHHLDDGHRNIVTIEDPVEYLVPQFLQIEVDPRHGRSPASGLKTVLRMDADVILLGEIRDPDTATAAMTAASCGKRVLTTLHARDAAAAITTLRQLNVDDRSTATFVRGVISQRLVRRVCPKCRGFREPSDSDRELFSSEGVRPPEHLAVPVGCSECRGVGYRGRIGMFEIATFDPDLATAVAAGKEERELRRLLRERGIEGLRADGLAKASEGLTTLEEVGTTCWPQ
jgi:type II secretory ATPase GspE/PulE/Tfp pilus assembly ATPase PilB-like protein